MRRWLAILLALGLAWAQPVVLRALIVKARALQGHAPTRKDAFEDPEVLGKYPYYREAQAIIARAKKVPIFAYTAEMEDVVGREISLAASGQKRVKEALRDAARGLEALLRRAGLLR